MSSEAAQDWNFLYLETDTASEGKLTNMAVRQIGELEGWRAERLSVTEDPMDFSEYSPRAVATFINRHANRIDKEDCTLSNVNHALEGGIPAAVIYDNLRPFNKEPFQFDKRIEVIKLSAFNVGRFGVAIAGLAAWLGSLKAEAQA